MTLYVSDLDGTLLNHASKVKPRSADMLNYFISVGALFSYATARSFSTAYQIVKDINIDIPVITMNGVIIADSKTGEPLIKNYPTASANAFARDTLTTLGEFPLVYAEINGAARVSYLESGKKHVKYYLDMRKGDKRMRPCKTADELFEGEIYYYTIIDPINSREVLDEYFVGNGFSANYQEDCPGSNCWWYEICADTANKAHAVQQLANYVHADRIVCFGDNINDIPMLTVADVGCAVANAYDEVKAAADCVIGSNEAGGVAMYIEKEVCPIHRYSEHDGIIAKPDNKRFEAAVTSALGREISTIGTLNEKNLHSALKHYFAPEYSQEAKIGGYYADAVTENGIIEIQTRSFGKLNDKLAAFLQACHVTVVYPYEKIVHNMYIDNGTGELLKASPKRKMNNLSQFFLELYRIKAFLSNPNLTICIAELEIEKARFVDDARCIRKRGQRVDKVPLGLVREIYLEKPSDYAFFLPDGLPDEFTVEDFSRYCKNSDAKLMMEILEYMTVIERVGKRGNAFVYRAAVMCNS